MTEMPHISSDDLALIALGAFSPAESAAYAAHLDACEQCRHELAELRGDMALLAMTSPVHPLPAAARERFLTSIGAGSETKPAAQARVPTPAPVVAMPVRPSRAVYVWQAIAAVLLIALALHAYQVQQLKARVRADDGQVAAMEEKNEAMSADNAKARRVLEVLTATHAQRAVLLPAHSTPEPQGHLVYIAESGSLVFQADHLKPLPVGKTYELWVIPANGAAPVPAGLFQPDVAGNGSVVLPNIPQGVTAKAFGVTMEDAAGAATPTMPILISGAAS
jgi:Anti-sigma-K factor rskA